MSWRKARQQAQDDEASGDAAVARIVGQQSQSPEQDQQDARDAFERAAAMTLQPHDHPRGETQ